MVMKMMIYVHITVSVAEERIKRERDKEKMRGEMMMMRGDERGRRGKRKSYQN